MLIAEFEKKVGLPRDTLRYYEKIGLLTAPSRGANGYRLYSDTQLKELAFIMQGKSIGFTLPVIKNGYRRYKELGYLCPEFTRQLREQKAMFSARIAEDTRAIAEIEKLLASQG